MLTNGETETTLTRTAALWPALGGSHIFVTGGTGFFGRWMLSLFSAANRRFAMGAQVMVLTRDRVRAAKRLKKLVDDAVISLHEGELVSLRKPKQPFQIVLHLAGEPHGPKYATDPAGMAESMIEGTRQLLAYSHQCGSPQVLFISSGAVYGPHHDSQTIDEDVHPQPESSPSRRAYAEAKRAGEELSLASNLPVKIARPFAFLGPGLPLDSAFAASEFIADGLNNRPVHVRHGGIVRSYLDGLDLAEWLWTTLLKGQPGRAYNIGSERTVTLRDLGGMVAEQCNVDFTVDDDTVKHRYVPSTRRAREELNLTQTIDLTTSVARTIHWHREHAHASPGG